MFNVFVKNNICLTLYGDRKNNSLHAFHLLVVLVWTKPNDSKIKINKRNQQEMYYDNSTTVLNQ